MIGELTALMVRVYGMTSAYDCHNYGAQLGVYVEWRGADGCWADMPEWSPQDWTDANRGFRLLPQIRSDWECTQYHQNTGVPTTWTGEACYEHYYEANLLPGIRTEGECIHFGQIANVATVWDHRRSQCHMLNTASGYRLLPGITTLHACLDFGLRNDVSTRWDGRNCWVFAFGRGS